MGKRRSCIPSARPVRPWGRWLECLLRGRRRRLGRRGRRSPAATFSAAHVELLETRTLLTAIPFSENAIATLVDASAAVAADVDGDGHTDMVAASGAAAGAGRIVFYRNSGAASPEFSPVAVATSLSEPRALAAADIDGDGDLDVVAAVYSGLTNGVFWYENTLGDGSMWEEHAVGGAGDRPVDVTVADIDGDGDLDVAAALNGNTDGDGFFAWYENDGAPTPAFTARPITTAVTGSMNMPRSIVAGDFDGDGDTDLAGASYGNDTIQWFENQQIGGIQFFTSFTITTTADGVIDLAAGDVDLDGDVDLLAAAYLQDEILWFESNGLNNPTFTERSISTDLNGPITVEIADVDMDGDNDIVASARYGAGILAEDEIVWFENDGDRFTPFFTPRTIATAAEVSDPAATFVADIDGDGDMDLVSASVGDDTLAWWENNSVHRTVRFAEPLPLTLPLRLDPGDGAYAVVTGDINGDGATDVVASSIYDNAVRWFENDGDRDNPFFFSRNVGTQLQSVRSLALGDVDGDGDLDIVAASSTDNSIGVWFNTAGDGSSWSFFFVDFRGLAVARSVVLADIDGDGDLDIAAAGGSVPGNSVIVWYRNTGGGSFTRQPSIDTFGVQPRSLAVGDIDGDGDIDVVSASYGNDRVAWHENTDGDGSTWARRTISQTVDGARSVAVGDVDRDGDLDVAVASAYDSTIRWFANNGLGVPWSRHLIGAGETGAQFAGLADFDKDGDLDVLSVASFPDGSSSRIAVFQSNGAAVPVWSRLDVDTANERPVSAAIGDVNNDGQLDFVATVLGADPTDPNDSRLLFYENGAGSMILETEDTSPDKIIAGERDDVLKITAAHGGRPGDSGIELATLELLFEESPGDPLTTAEANELIFEMTVWMDDGDGDFDDQLDARVATVDPIFLDAAGVGVVAFADGDPNVQFTVGQTRTYFVVLEFAANAFVIDGPKQVIVTHLTASTSTAEDAVHDIPVDVATFPNTATTLIEVGQPNVPVPGRAVFTNPIGITTDATPTIRWAPPANAEFFRLLVYSLQTGQPVIDVPKITGTAFTPGTPLPVGPSFSMFVQAFNVANQAGAFSNPEFFSIDPAVLPPAPPVLTGPAETVQTTTPTITWVGGLRADDFTLEVYDTIRGRRILRQTGLTGTQFTPLAPLPPGPYQAFLFANNAGGSTLSKSLMFNTATTPAGNTRPLLVGPAESIPDSTPTITWVPVAGAGNQEVEIYNIQRGKLVLVKSGVDVVGSSLTLAADDALEPGFSYQVFVRGQFGDGSFTPFSEPLVFDLISGAPLPGRAMLRTPAPPTGDSTPTFIWDRLPQAATFQLFVFNLVTGRPTLFVPGISGRFHVPGGNFAPGRYQAFVRGVNELGEAGEWSPAHVFEITQTDKVKEVPVDETDDENREPPDDLPLFDSDEIQLVYAVEKPAARIEDRGSRIPSEVRSQRSGVRGQESEVRSQQSAAEVARLWPNSGKFGYSKDHSLLTTHHSPIELDAVLSAWPQTDWWQIPPEQRQDRTDASDTSVRGAMSAGLALTAGLATVQDGNNVRRPGEPAAGRRRGRRVGSR